tara:strand:+ start:492 stop:1064 length:573 start_codon:yes stop_codon:yes gene_type:complete
MNNFTLITFGVRILSLLILLFQIPTVLAQDTETQTYRVIKEYNAAELRYYPPVMKIQSNNDFGSLFNYISGNNSTREKISMTSPVHMGEVDGNNVMAFVLPEDFNPKNTPDALSKGVKVFESEPGYFLALEFGGYASKKNVRYYASELSNIAQKYGLITIGMASLLVYDSPYKVLGRKNEVIIQIIEDSI